MKLGGDPLGDFIVCARRCQDNYLNVRRGWFSWVGPSWGMNRVLDRLAITSPVVRRRGRLVQGEWYWLADKQRRDVLRRVQSVDPKSGACPFDIALLKWRSRGF